MILEEEAIPSLAANRNWPFGLQQVVIALQDISMVCMAFWCCWFVGAWPRVAPIVPKRAFTGCLHHHQRTGGRPRDYCPEMVTGIGGTRDKAEPAALLLLLGKREEWPEKSGPSAPRALPLSRANHPNKTCGGGMEPFASSILCVINWPPGASQNQGGARGV